MGCPSEEVLRSAKTFAEERERFWELRKDVLASITESKKLVEESRNLLERSHQVLDKARRILRY